MLGSPLQRIRNANESSQSVRFLTTFIGFGSGLLANGYVFFSSANMFNTPTITSYFVRGCQSLAKSEGFNITSGDPRCNVINPDSIPGDEPYWQDYQQATAYRIGGEVLTGGIFLINLLVLVGVRILARRSQARQIENRSNERYLKLPSHSMPRNMLLIFAAVLNFSTGITTLIIFSLSNPFYIAGCEKALDTKYEACDFTLVIKKDDGDSDFYQSTQLIVGYQMFLSLEIVLNLVTMIILCRQTIYARRIENIYETDARASLEALLGRNEREQGRQERADEGRIRPAVHSRVKYVPPTVPPPAAPL